MVHQLRGDAGVFIDQLSNAGALPSLELTMRFAAQRQQLIAHNIANVSTPDFIPLDASPREFQRVLGDAVDRRRGETGGMQGELAWDETRELTRDTRGELRIEPSTPSGNVLFQDRNNRDLEKMLQDLSENAAVFRTASELMRTQVNQLQRAIAERVS